MLEGVDLFPTDSKVRGPLTPVTEETDEDEEGLNGASDSDSGEGMPAQSSPHITKSCSEFKLGSSSEQKTKTAFSTLSKSLGAQDFQHPGSGGNSDPEEVFSDALTEHQERLKEADSQASISKDKKQKSGECDPQKNGNVFVSAAISIEYPSAPATAKYIR